MPPSAINRQVMGLVRWQWLTISFLGHKIPPGCTIPRGPFCEPECTMVPGSSPMVLHNSPPGRSHFPGGRFVYPRAPWFRFESHGCASRQSRPGGGY